MKDKIFYKVEIIVALPHAQFLNPCVGFRAELSRFFHREVSHL